MKFHLKSIVIALFLLVYMGSFFYLNSFYKTSQKSVSSFINGIDLDKKLSKLEITDPEKRDKLRQLALDYNESIAEVEISQKKAKIYSSIFVFILMVISTSIFVFLFHYLTKPLEKLEDITHKIQEGNFDVRVEEDGFLEIKELQKSFNKMSSKLKDTQTRLLKAEKEATWKEISRMLAHEIKNPLTPIKLTLQRLEEKFYLDSEGFNEIFENSITIIYQEIKNLSNLSHSFSAFAKRKKVKREVIDLDEEITKIVKPYKLKYNVITKVDNNRHINFDRSHFYEIMTNILKNGIEACVDNEEKISIYTKIIDNYDVLIIEDNGKGISKEDLKRIFEPYFSKKKKGTGLGLALVKKLVELNKAYISVDSELGKGTTFKIFLEEFNENSDS